MDSKNQQKTDAVHKDVYTIVTERIITLLERGTVPWRQPWHNGSLPINLVSKRPYQGINLLLLASLGYDLPIYLTSKQLNEIGGSIKPDEKPHIVVFWNYIGKSEEDVSKEEDKKKTPYLRYYTVFNVAQCTGIPNSKIPSFKEIDFVPINKAEETVSRMPNAPSIKHKEQRAFYDPLRDAVNMPKKTTFKSPESYYSTLFHELIHSTGHRTRLSRKTLLEMAEFGSDPYSIEELVAEIGACYLLSCCGIETVIEQNASYINGWLSQLKSDKKFIFSASRQAQKATNYILDIKEDEMNSE